MHGLIQQGTRRVRIPGRRQFRNGRRLAAVRAITAAKLYLSKAVPTLKAAVEACGTNYNYVRAAIILLKAENTSLLARVVAGEILILAAAREVERLSKLVASYRAATANDHVAFAKIVGPTVLFDDMLVPAV